MNQEDIGRYRKRKFEKRNPYYLYYEMRGLS
jgi:hypothetical protein